MYFKCNECEADWTVSKDDLQGCHQGPTVMCECCDAELCPSCYSDHIQQQEMKYAEKEN